MNYHEENKILFLKLSVHVKYAKRVISCLILIPKEVEEKFSIWVNMLYWHLNFNMTAIWYTESVWSYKWNKIVVRLWGMKITKIQFKWPILCPIKHPHSFPFLNLNLIKCFYILLCIHGTCVLIAIICGLIYIRMSSNISLYI